MKPTYHYVFAFVIMPKHFNDGEQDFKQKLLGGSFTESVLVAVNQVPNIKDITKVFTEKFIPEKYKKNYIAKPLNDGEYVKGEEVSFWKKTYAHSFIDLTDKK